MYVSRRIPKLDIGGIEMRVKDQGMHRPEELPRCPKCNSVNSVGRVMSVNATNVYNCYFCSNCLKEFDNKGNLKVDMYA